MIIQDLKKYSFENCNDEVFWELCEQVVDVGMFRYKNLQTLIFVV